MTKKKQAAKPAAESNGESVAVSVEPLGSFTQDEQNPRLHGDRNKRAIAKSIERFGAGRSIVADKNNRVVAGNGTLEAAMEAGFDEAIVVEPKPNQLVVVRKNFTQHEGRAYSLADNQTNMLSEWHEGFVELALAEIQLSGDDTLLEATGFDAVEIASFTGDSPVEPAQPQPPNTASEFGKPIVVTAEQRAVLELAIAKVRESEDDPSMSEGRCLELAIGDWIAGK